MNEDKKMFSIFILHAMMLNPGPYVGLDKIKQSVKMANELYLELTDKDKDG